MQKPCKSCEKKRWGSTSWCYLHYRERIRLKRQEKAKKKLERKIKTKKYQESEYKKLWKKCWKLMSELVRRDGADWRGYAACFTCDKVFHWKQLQAGHRHHRRLDFDPRNVRKQCWTCNGKQSLGGKSGNLGEYERRLCKLYGHEWCEKLLLDANTHPGYRTEELKAIYNDLREKMSKL